MFRYLKKLLFVLPATKWSLFRIVILFLFTSALEVLGIGIVGPFIGLANDPSLIQKNLLLRQAFVISGFESENKFLVSLGLIAIVAFCTKSFFSWFTQAYIVKFSDEQQRKLVSRMTHEYLKAPYIYHTQKSTTSIVDSIIEVVNMFTMTVLNPLLTSISNAFIIGALFALLMSTNATIMMAILVVIIPVFVFFNSFKARLHGWGKQARKSKEGIIRSVGHATGGIKETKIIGCEPYFEKKVSDEAGLFSRSHTSFVKFKIMPRFVMEAVMVSCVISIICVYLGFNQDTESLTSVLGIYALSSVRLLPAISNLIGGIGALRNSSYTVYQIHSDLKELQDIRSNLVKEIEIKSKYKASASGVELSTELDFLDEILIDNISYRYPGAEREAIHNLSLSIKKGESIAFIGKSGAGKTTLVDIILGLLTPQVGDLRVDGVSIYKDQRAWQNMIGYIPQSIFLIEDSIERNIAFGVPDHLIDQTRLQKAIEAAQLQEVIDRLPDGLDTNVGERGILLSGGQRQRVGIARALYHEREILVLDEATAALDNETEKLVTDAIRGLSGRKTVIMIAHRLSTVEHCNCIYLLEHGRVVKSGSYDEVVLNQVRG